jgi:hypothetical protein
VSNDRKISKYGRKWKEEAVAYFEPLSNISLNGHKTTTNVRRTACLSADI